MNTNTGIADVLYAAADHIERYGWVTGSYAADTDGDDPGPQACCAAGAINYVRTGEVSRDAGSEMVKIALLESLGHDLPLVSDLDDRIADWNDNDAGSPQVVVAQLRAAADRAEREALRIAVDNSQCDLAREFEPVNA